MTESIAIRDDLETIAYGPVPSRRLGRSLGVNNIPPKSCSYGCGYCQVGHTLDMKLDRRDFYPPKELIRVVSARLDALRAAGQGIDYLSIVPDGEPTLDLHLGELIEGLGALGLPVAVISNSSLIARPDVREELALADWVSLKVDAVVEESWRRVNRPNARLMLPAILEGMLAFAQRYSGTLVTETMLVAGVNDGAQDATLTARFLSRLRPSIAYLSVPTRPPSTEGVAIPDSEALLQFFGALERSVDEVEMLLGYEGNAFATAGDPVANLLSITAVHPMREAAVVELLQATAAPWSLVDGLVSDGRLLEVDYAGHRYYLRRPPAR